PLAEKRADDDQPVINQRIAVYNRQTAPLLGYYRKKGLLRSVNAMASPDEVFEQIKAVLNFGENDKSQGGFFARGKVRSWESPFGRCLRLPQGGTPALP